MIWQILGIFVAVIILDILWAKYIQHVGEKRPVKAANYAVLLYLLGAFAVTSYVDNPYLLIPASLGSWIGTYWGSRKS